MKVHSVNEIVSNEKVCVRVEADFSYPQMYVTQDKEVLRSEIGRLQEWVHAQRFENMDLSISLLEGNRCILLMYLTVGRKMEGVTPCNDDDTFRHQHKFIFSWCSKCLERCQFFDPEVDNYRGRTWDYCLTK